MMQIGKQKKMIWNSLKKKRKHCSSEKVLLKFLIQNIKERQQRVNLLLT